MSGSEPIFKDIGTDASDPEVTEIESYCVNCEENGMTRLMLTKIPFYKEVVLMSFSCDHCGYENNEIQSGARISEQGVKITLNVKTTSDMNRQIVKSDTATFTVPHIEFEIPPKSQKGEVTTLEGIISRAVTGLLQEQPVRRISHPEDAQKIDDFVEKLEQAKTVNHPYTVILDDPAGNCYIENPHLPDKDPHMYQITYKRSEEQDHQLGIYPEHDATADMVTSDEVLGFQMNCPGCNAPVETNMKLTKIPNFKEVIIMATACDACGLRTNEVKSGSGIEPKGQLIKLQITSIEDLSRDVLKSDTCTFLIPELDFESGAATLGGKFTTVEGLIRASSEQLLSTNPMLMGDSAEDGMVSKIKLFTQKLEAVASGEEKCTIVLDDPAGNSYLQNLFSPDVDPHLEVTLYERNHEQNEELGINDMRLTDYTDT